MKFLTWTTDMLQRENLLVINGLNQKMNITKMNNPATANRICNMAIDIKGSSVALLLNFFIKLRLADFFFNNT